MNDKRMRMSMIARAGWRENGVEVEIGVEGMEDGRTDTWDEGSKKCRNEGRLESLTIVTCMHAYVEYMDLDPIPMLIQSVIAIDMIDEWKGMNE